MVIGASEHKCQSVDDVVSLLKKGSTVRHTGATQMNDESSRSHAIFTLYIGKNVTSISLYIAKLSFAEQRLRDTNSNNVQASFDAMVKPLQSTFDGENEIEYGEVLEGLFYFCRELSFR